MYDIYFECASFLNYSIHKACIYKMILILSDGFIFVIVVVVVVCVVIVVVVYSK